MRSTVVRFLVSVHAAVIRENTLSMNALVTGMLKAKNARAVMFGALTCFSRAVHFDATGFVVAAIFPLRVAKEHRIHHTAGSCPVLKLIFNASAAPRRSWKLNSCLIARHEMCFR